MSVACTVHLKVCTKVRLPHRGSDVAFLTFARFYFTSTARRVARRRSSPPFYFEMSTVPPPPMASAAARARGSSTPLSSESFSRTLTKPRAPTSLLARRGTKDVTLTDVPLTLTAEAILANSAGRTHARSVSITPAPVKVSGRGQRPWQRPWASVVVGAPAPDDDAAAYQQSQAPRLAALLGPCASSGRDRRPWAAHSQGESPAHWTSCCCALGARASRLLKANTSI